MKKLLFSLLSIFIITGCLETDEIFREIPSDQDQFSLQEMEASFELASFYNDSLEYFTDIVPDLDVALFYDDLFHFHDALFDQYHQQYSHLNAYDDHHHVANPPDHRHSDDRHMDPDFFVDAGHAEDDADHAEDDADHDEDDGDHDEDEGDHDEDEGDHDEDEGDHDEDEGDHDEDEGDHDEDEGDHDEDEGDHDEDEGDHDEDEGEHAEDEGDHDEDDADHDEEANPDIYTHNLDTYTKMLSLRQHHKEYHPKN